MLGFINNTISIEDIKRQVRSCDKCVFGSHSKKRVPGCTNEQSEPPILNSMIVTDYPGTSEELSGIPMIGPSGTLLRTELINLLVSVTGIRDFGNDPRSIYSLFFLTNVIKCIPRRFVFDKVKIDKPRPSEIKKCSNHFILELASIKPKAILAAGSTSIKFVTGMDKQKYGDVRQSLYPCAFDKNIAVICTMNPAAILHSKDDKEIFEKKTIQFQEDLVYFISYLKEMRIIPNGKESRGNEDRFETPID